MKDEPKDILIRLFKYLHRRIFSRMLPLVQAVTLANSSGKKMVAQYLWESYTPALFLSLVLYLIARVMMSFDLEEAGIELGTIIFIFAEAVSLAAFSSRFRNKSGYSFSAFHLLPVSPEMLVRYLFSFYLAGIFMSVGIVGVIFIHHTHLYLLYVLLSVKLIMFLMFGGFLIDHWSRWLLFTAGMVLLGLTVSLAISPDLFFLQLPLLFISSLITYRVVVISLYMNRGSERRFISKIAAVMASPDKKVLSFFNTNSRRMNPFSISFFNREKSRGTMLFWVLMLQETGIVFGIFVLAAILSSLLWYFTHSILLTGIMAIPGILSLVWVWMAYRIQVTAANYGKILATFPVACEEMNQREFWVNYPLNLMLGLTMAVAFVYFFPRLIPLKDIFYYVTKGVLFLFWVTPLLNLKRYDEREIHRFIEINSSIFRINNYLGYFLIPFIIFLVFFNSFIYSSWLPGLIVLISLAAFYQLWVKFSQYLVLGKKYNIYGPKTYKLYGITALLTALLTFMFLYFLIPAGFLSRMFSLPLNSSSALVIYPLLAFFYGANEGLRVFFSTVGIFLRRHQ